MPWRFRSKYYVVGLEFYCIRGATAFTEYVAMLADKIIPILLIGPQVLGRIGIALTPCAIPVCRILGALSF